MRGLLVLLILCSVANANPAPKPDTSWPDVDLAVAVNPPFRWPGGDAVAGSVYIGLTNALALRFNVARYDYIGNPAGNILLGLLEGGGDEAIHSGRILDGGISLVHFTSGRLHRGFFVELGALVRDNDTRVEDDFASSYIVETDTTVFAARAMLGYSYRAADLVFVSLSLGASGGYERGKEVHRPDPTINDRMPTTKNVSRDALAVEGWMRIGLDFGK